MQIDNSIYTRLKKRIGNFINVIHLKVLNHTDLATAGYDKCDVTAIAINEHGDVIVHGVGGSIYGNALIYELDAPDVVVLTPRNKDESRSFGSTVAINQSGTRIAISYVHNHLVFIKGCVDIYKKDLDTGEWLYETTVTSASDVNAEYFGCALAFSGSGNTLVVGSHGENTPIADGCGLVYIYDFNSTWNLSAKLYTVDSTPSGGFGVSVTIDQLGYNILVGAPHAGISGLIYSFSRMRSSAEDLRVWSHTQTLYPDNDSITHVGASVSVSKDGSVLVASGVRSAGISEGIIVTFVYNPILRLWLASDVINSMYYLSEDRYGSALHMNHNGTMLVTNTTLDGNPAFMIYSREHDTWHIRQTVLAETSAHPNMHKVAMSSDGTTIVTPFRYFATPDTHNGDI